MQHDTVTGAGLVRSCINIRYKKQVTSASGINLIVNGSFRPIAAIRWVDRLHDCVPI
jgi:hypothetical protein